MGLRHARNIKIVKWLGPCQSAWTTQADVGRYFSHIFFPTEHGLLAYSQNNSMSDPQLRSFSRHKNNTPMINIILTRIFSFYQILSSLLPQLCDNTELLKTLIHYLPYTALNEYELNSVSIIFQGIKLSYKCCVR